MSVGIGKVTELIGGITSIRDNMVFTIGEVVLRQEGVIIEGVTDNMWNGIDGYHRSIKPPYTQFTIRIKKAKGDPYDRVTLRDTGAFYGSLFVSNVGDGFLVGSRNTRPWHPDLPEIYGYAVLRPDSESLYEEIIVPLQKEIVKQLKSIKL